MPFAYPDLVNAHTQDTGPYRYPYYGLRERTRLPKLYTNPDLQPYFTWPDIHIALGRTQGSFHNWEIGAAPMPAYLSAYMALLRGHHPTYVLEKGFYRDGKPKYLAKPASKAFARGVPKPDDWFPAIPTGSREDAAELMDRYGLTDEDVLAGLCLPDHRCYSASTVAHDGVRWLMLRLMCDDVYGLHVRLREPHERERLAAEAQPLGTRAEKFKAAITAKLAREAAKAKLAQLSQTRGVDAEAAA